MFQLEGLGNLQDSSATGVTTLGLLSQVMHRPVKKLRNNAPGDLNTTLSEDIQNQSHRIFK